MPATAVGTTAYQISASPSSPLENTAGCHSRPPPSTEVKRWPPEVGPSVPIRATTRVLGSVVENEFDAIDSDGTFCSVTEADIVVAVRAFWPANWTGSIAMARPPAIATYQKFPGNLRATDSPFPRMHSGFWYGPATSLHHKEVLWIQQGVGEKSEKCFCDIRVPFMFLIDSPLHNHENQNDSLSHEARAISCDRCRSSRRAPPAPRRHVPTSSARPPACARRGPSGGPPAVRPATGRWRRQSRRRRPPAARARRCARRDPRTQGSSTRLPCPSPGPRRPSAGYLRRCAPARPSPLHRPGRTRRRA